MEDQGVEGGRRPGDVVVSGDRGRGEAVVVVGVEVVVVVVRPGEARGRAGRGGEGSQVLIVRAGVDPRRPGRDQHRLRCNKPA